MKLPDLRWHFPIRWCRVSTDAGLTGGESFTESECLLKALTDSCLCGRIMFLLDVVMSSLWNASWGKIKENSRRMHDRLNMLILKRCHKLFTWKTPSWSFCYCEEAEGQTGSNPAGEIMERGKNSGCSNVPSLNMPQTIIQIPLRCNLNLKKLLFFCQFGGSRNKLWTQIDTS